MVFVAKLGRQVALEGCIALGLKASMGAPLVVVPVSPRGFLADLLLLLDLVLSQILEQSPETREREASCQESGGNILASDLHVHSGLLYSTRLNL